MQYYLTTYIHLFDWFGFCRSGYKARTPQELPVLVRWFDRDGSVEIPDATVLDLILYSYVFFTLPMSFFAKPNQSRQDFGCFVCFWLFSQVFLRMAYIDLLYSREQLVKEAEAMGNKHTDEEYDWGLISVKGQLENFELPMTPMTMLRFVKKKIHFPPSEPTFFNNVIVFMIFFVFIYFVV
jgi:hypothetical protein